MGHKILTLDNLYQFFVEQNKTVSFSSKESGAPIVVTTKGFFETLDNDMPGMLKLKLKTCHIEKNRNGSHISKHNMEKAMPTLKYRPILAYIHKLPDGTEDFYAHNVEIIEREDGETEINYIEKQVGCFTADEPWLEYDEKMDKTYVMAYGVIPEEYTSAANIIRRKQGTKVSCELVINELAYNAKEKYLDLTDFYFGGTTLLGCDDEGNEIGEGMLGSRADIEDFCHKEPVFAYQDKLIETLEKLNITLESFNNTHNAEEKGGEKVMGRFEELLAKYGKTIDEVTFEYENLSDEELESAFKEAFEDVKDEPAVTVEETVIEEDDNGVPDKDIEEPTVEVVEEVAVDVVEESDDDEQPRDEKFVRKYELSHDDIRLALYNLLDAESENCYYGAWIVEVYDDKFIYQDYMENKFYRQGYSRDGESVALGDNKVEVFSEWLSKEEKDALHALKNNYADLEIQYNDLKTFKDNYEAEKLKAQKDAVFARSEYSVLADDSAFKALINDADKYSVEEIETKADVIFAKFIKASGEYSAKPETKKSKTLGFNYNAEPSEEELAYGGLFKKK